MKKTLVILAILALSLPLASCGVKGDLTLPQETSSTQNK